MKSKTLRDFCSATILMLTTQASAALGQMQLHMIEVGKSPNSIVALPKAQRIYVANQGGDSISVIDMHTNRVAATVAGCAAPFDVVARADEAFVYVSCQNENAIGVLDTKANQLVHKIAMQGGLSPSFISITPDGKKLYVSNIYGVTTRFQGNLNVIDTQSISVIATVTNTPTALVGLGCPEGNAITPDGKYLYLNTQCATAGGHRSYDPIFIVDVATDTVVRELAAAYASVGSGMAITPDGRQAWAAGGDACSAPWPEYERARREHGAFVCGKPGGNPITVIDTKTRKWKQIFYGAPNFISFSSEKRDEKLTRYAYVATDVGLLVIDTTTLASVRKIPVGGITGRLAFSQDGKTAYAALPAKNALAVFRLTGI